MNALVLAGSSNKGELYEHTNIKDEALIKIGNKTMVEYVVEAIKGSQNIDKIILVGPEAQLSDLFAGEEKVEVTGGGTTVIEGVLNGLRLVDVEKKLLVATSDIPLLTAEAIDDFIELCRQKDGDLFYPIIPREAVERFFPGTKRTYFNLTEGVFTGGNLFYVDPKVIPTCADVAEEVVKLRKSPVKLAKMLGIPFIFKFLLKRLSIGEVERQASRILKVKGVAVISQCPEVGIDVDKPSDLELVQSVFNSRQQ